MKKIAKFIVNGIDHMVNLIALLLVLMTMFLSCYMLWDSNQVYQAADAKNYETYIPTEKHTKSFEELQKINPDVIGWIRVNDTNINYPLLQTDDDDTYMNTDAEGKYSLSGAIFLHCGNKPDFSDFNNIIYGHHMEKEKMFGDIGNFTDETYFDEHPYGNLFFDGKDHGIEFYALMQIDAYNETIFNVCPDTSEAKQAYLLEIIDNALYKREIKQYNALYAAAVKNGYSVTDEQVQAYIEDMKLQLESVDNSEDIQDVIDQFDSEDDYWAYEFTVYQKQLPIQNYVSALNDEYNEKAVDSFSEEAQEEWDTYFENLKDKLVKEQNFKNQ